MEDYLKQLNNEQLQAVTINKKKVLVIAGAGSGKTRVLTSRIRYLLESGVSPNEIIAFTFTNKAIGELKSRLTAFEFYNAYTFHSYAFQMIRMHYQELGYREMPNLLSDTTMVEILKEILQENGINQNYKYFLSYISKRKSGATITNLTTEEAALCNKVYYLFQTKMNHINYLSFDDMVPLFLNNIDNLSDKDSIYNECKYILVDECQDINHVQYDLIKKLSNKYNNIFMVGDNDQMIYSFRESDISIIHEFQASSDEVILLNQNYRCSKNILSLANRLIHFNKNRQKKNLFSTIEPKHQIICTTYKSSQEEAYGTMVKIKHLHDDLHYEYKDIAVLYRNNYQASQIEYELNSAAIPYTTYGTKPFYETKQVKKMIAVYRLLQNSNDEIALREFLLVEYYIFNQFLQDYHTQDKSLLDYASNYPDDKIKAPARALVSLKETKELYTKSSFFDELLSKLILPQIENAPLDSIYQLKDIIISSDKIETEVINSIYLESNEPHSNGVNLLTIHKSKGLEFKCVILIGLNNGILPAEQDKNIEEERRLCYVAITRAKECLFMSSSRENIINGKRKSFNPSRFIIEMKSNNGN